ncbi:MAG: ABC transporter ATP-binding protein [Minisyncoccia bacterium]
MNIVNNYIKAVFFSMKYAYQFIRKYLFLLSFLYIIRGALPYLNSYLLGLLINRIVYGGKAGLNSLWWLFLAFAFVSALPAIIRELQRYFERLGMLQFQMDMHMVLMTKRAQIDIGTHEDPEFQNLLQRANRNGGTNPIFQITRSQYDTINSLTGFIVGTILATNFSWLVYFVVIISAIPNFLLDIKYAKAGWSIWSKESAEQRKLDDLRDHIISKVRLIELKLLLATDKFLAQIRKIFEDFAGKQRNLEKSRVWVASLADILSFVGFTFGLWLVVRGVIDSNYQVGTFVFMIGTLTNVRSSISGLLDSISGQYENCLVVNDLIKFINIEPSIHEKKNPDKLNLKSAPEVVFENVSFKYPNTEKWILKDINIKFNAGDNIGLVGNNGAGKTTLVKLLCRIYDPTEGRILINGIDLKDVATKEWWSNLGVMFQDYASYDFIVEEAIAIGKPEKPSNLTKVIDAAKVSQAHEFIMEWKDKYDQQLGVEFGGKEPSKGQKQKMSIAKILYRDGLVMILDEPTASVDAESEAKIFDSIENLPKDRTAILISHDFSTISQCDKIFVMDKGKLVEEGTHKELMKNKKMYSELYKLQADRFKK